MTRQYFGGVICNNAVFYIFWVIGKVILAEMAFGQGNECIQWVKGSCLSKQERPGGILVG